MHYTPTIQLTLQTVQGLCLNPPPAHPPRWGGGDCENFGAKIEQRRQKVSTEHPINEATLSRLADSVPDKYRYNEQLGGSYKTIGVKI